MTEMTGRITLVWTEDIGTALTQDEAAGATVLHVDDVSPFNDDGELDEDGNLGYLLVGSQTVGYTAVDDDASTITLAEALAEDADEDDSVSVWNDLYDVVDTEQWAWVEPDGKDRQDPIRARVKESLELDDGDRGRRGESCTIRRRAGSDDWRVSGVRGRPSKARGIQFESAEPAYTPTSDELTAGTFTRQLMHRNIAAEHGLFTTINGVALGSEWWSLDAAAGVVTVTIPDWVAEAPEGYREFGWPMYAYRRGIAVDPPEVEEPDGGGGDPPPDPVAVPLTVVGSTGTHVYTNVSNTQSLPLATPIVAGDLIVFACIGDGGTIACPDPRMSLEVNTTYGGKLVKIWLGVDDGSGSPLDIDVHYDNPSFTCEFSMLAVVIHPSAPVAWTGLVSDQSGASGSTVPGVSGVSGAVAIAVSSVSTAGGDYGWLWPAPWGSQFQEGVYRYITSAFQAGPTIGGTALSTTGGHSRRGFLLGIGMG